MWQQLKHYLWPASSIPQRFRHTSLKQIPWLAVDLELTSLDAKQSNILSIGWVQGKASMLSLDTCYYDVVNTQASLNQSPVIHGLLDDDIQQGVPVRQALARLAEFASTHVWVFHNTALDMSVLLKVYQKLGIQLPTIITVDTLQLALYQLKKNQQVPAPNAATLTSCRQRHNLPLAPAHNALDDAVATMELLFAQLYDFDKYGNQSLGELTISGAVKVFG